MGFNPPSMRKQDLTPEQIEIQRKKGFDRWLPYPVSSNQLHQPVQGGIILTAKARQYYSEVVRFLEDNDCPMLTGRLRVEVYVYDPDLRKRDINNLTKCLFDALEHAKVFLDDEQIDETYIKRCETTRGGKVRVKIKEIEGAAERQPIKKMEKEAKILQDEKDRSNLLKRAYGGEAVEGRRLFQIIRPGDVK